MKEKSKWDYKVPRKAREMKPRCNCVHSKQDTSIQCLMFNEQTRNKIHSEFWDLSWEEKRVFVCANMETEFAERMRDRKDDDYTRRTFTFKYFLPLGDTKIRVCCKMFLNTLSIGKWSVKNWKLNQGDKISPTLNRKKPNRTSISDRRIQCENFLDGLAKVESHYTRKDTNLLYVEPLWNSLSELYRTYVEEMGKSDIAPVSQCAFEQIFHSKKMCIFHPKKDHCDVCFSYKQGNVSKENYDHHIVLKDQARAEKEKDKASENVKVLTVDVQSVLLCPLNNSSSMYYKTKLVNHNYTVYDLLTHDVLCYLWNESDSNLQGSTFATMLCDYIANHSGCKAGDTIIIYSDGCTNQNRNVQVGNALLNLAIEKSITIIQKFLIKGHTQMEGDSVHACIERKIRHRSINVPSDYCRFISEARIKKPYKVKYLDFNFFKSFEGIKFVNSLRPPVSSSSSTDKRPKVVDIRCLKYCPSGEILYKLDFAKNFELLRQPRTRSKSKHAAVPPKFTPFQELPALYTAKLKISKEKYEHIQSLLPTIPHDHHLFYKNLPHL